MFNKMILKTMLGKHLKGIPKDQQDKIIDMILKNPELFKKIAEEIQVKVKSGMDQAQAAMSVMEGYKEQMKDLL
jgi:hypothetical protein